MSEVTANPSPLVSVYGSSATRPDEPEYHAASALGRAIAERGGHVACGGYAGIMEAAAKGAREAGGRAVGYTVEGWRTPDPNEWISDERKQPDLFERLRRLIVDADALIAVGGGIGTLAEVALAWNLLYLDLIPARPLIIVGEKWRATFEAMADNLEISEAHRACIRVCSDNDDCIAQLEKEGVFS